jgi:hypothetical protein
LNKTKNILQIPIDDSQEPLYIGYVKCQTILPTYNFFFEINKQNQFFFERKKDLIRHGEYFDYYYSVYEAKCETQQINYRFFSNHPIHTIQTKEISDLFGLEMENKFLVDSSEIIYIASTSYFSANFSLILQTEKSIFQLEVQEIFSNDELFELIQYYE